jgi:transposase
MPPARYIQLTVEEDQRLREIEHSPDFRPKVRLRAQVLRLSHQGWQVERISSYSGRSRTSILRDFERWNEHGFEGLADGTAPGQPERITNEMREHMLKRLGEERAWTARQLADDLGASFGVRVTPEAIRLRLKQLGYCWKRTRYVPCHNIEPDNLRDHRASLETLKRGHAKDA